MNDHPFGKELFIRFTARVFREHLLNFVCVLLSFLVLRLLTSVALQLFERKGRGFIIVIVCYDQGKREEAGYRNKLQPLQVIAEK